MARIDRQLTFSAQRARKGLETGAKRGRELSRRLTPVEEGDLRNSYVVNTEAKKTGARAVLANTAPYAARVHEQVAEKLRGQKRPNGRKGNYWDGGESKFMEKGVYNNKSDILLAIQKASRFTRIK